MKRKIAKEVFLEILAISELSTETQSLILRAREASKNAHAPYSDFQVGAAVLLEGGEIVLGNNQENASFPVGICAERVALAAASANFPNRAPLKVAIVAKRRTDSQYKMVTPCGLCLQTMVEYEKKFNGKLEILLYKDDENIYRSTSVESFLPFRFSDF